MGSSQTTRETPSEEEVVEQWLRAEYSCSVRQSYHAMMAQWYGAWVLRMQALGALMIALGLLISATHQVRIVSALFGFLALVIVHVLRWPERARKHSDVASTLVRLAATLQVVDRNLDAIREVQREIDLTMDNDLPTRRVVLAMAHNRYADRTGADPSYKVVLKWRHKAFAFFIGNVDLPTGRTA